MATPFDFISSISDTKKDIMESVLEEKEYSAFMVNRGLSQHADIIMLANEMNKNHHLPSAMQYRFLLYTVRKRKRYGKWAKATPNEDIQLICDFYKCSIDKARMYLNVLSTDDINQIKERLFTGGKKGKKK